MKYIAMGALLAAPLSVFAAPTALVGGELDLYVAPKVNLEASTTFGSSDIDGDGFGARLRAPVAETLMLRAEYQSLEFDGNVDFDEVRAGLGLKIAPGSSLIAEYNNFDNDGDSISGLGLHWRFDTAAAETVSLFGQVGYLMLEDDDGDELGGLEGNIGLAAQLSPGMSGFIDYRVSRLEYDDFNIDIDRSEFRVGVRIGF